MARPTPAQNASSTRPVRAAPRLVGLLGVVVGSTVTGGCGGGGSGAMFQQAMTQVGGVVGGNHAVADSVGDAATAADVAVPSVGGSGRWLAPSSATPAMQARGRVTVTVVPLDGGAAPDVGGGAADLMSGSLGMTAAASGPRSLNFLVTVRGAAPNVAA